MPVISAAEFRDLMKSGKVKAGKNGRLALNGGAGSTKAPKKVQGPMKTGDRAFKPLKKPTGKSSGVLKIEERLKASGIEYVSEYRFSSTRRFRFDIAMPDLMIAIEYEGVMTNKSGHTTIGGYTKDCQKYNLAVSLGWKVYRYTALNLNELQNLIEAIHEIKNGEESGEEKGEKGREERKRPKPSRRAS